MGEAPKALTDGSAAVFNAVWSPDGKQIAYARMDSSRALQVWMMNAEGSGARPIRADVLRASACQMRHVYHTGATVGGSTDVGPGG
jgi:Tol biopolymer transport system component